MKRSLTILCFAVSLICFTALTATAIPISGEISFSGAYKVDNPDLSLATQFTEFLNVITQGATGDYSVIPDGTTAVFTSPITFAPITVPIIPLWHIVYGGKTYDFDATSMEVLFRTSNTLVIQGNGIGSITGFNDTPGLWNITANTLGTTFSFSASSAVPEPGSMLLLGLGLIGIGIVSRKK